MLEELLGKTVGLIQYLDQLWRTWVPFCSDHTWNEFRYLRSVQGDINLLTTKLLWFVILPCSGPAQPELEQESEQKNKIWAILV